MACKPLPHPTPPHLYRRKEFPYNRKEEEEEEEREKETES